ncbi:MAG: PfkB family carbohydrate kinase [Sedimentisphaerales bacterium]|nr:PfkB family carbohydrate kinase [Sedimentisphaerales bacterium]HNY76993.1 PfkB family carbohydrate kinase [Sedimentisphaerales bacterium]HOC64716.1 PfkB family carbohydrate kinase [Sedimentisphaerales bacterium]HOH62767.1 PfkB family carbohydrate kinase [Sedimentisphaerales bacterium]HPY49765.1 PfkB family carbohydrate kinase [Sedimentisphaerales bacterium]
MDNQTHTLLVTGSIGIDTVKTPHGVSEQCLGGSSIYFSMAASFFAPVRFVGVVGDDCPFDLAEIFRGRNVDLRGLEVRPGSKTFVWHGTYQENMNDRTTDYVELNVLQEAPPRLPKVFKDSRFVFLANTAPALQLELLEQITQPAFVAADTMNLWIEGHLADLKKLLKRIDCLIINDDEARLLSGRSNLVQAADDVLAMGMKVVIVKKGESGSLMCGADGRKFLLPAYPATEVIDPTGAGDSFAGGFLGCVAQQGRADFDTLKLALAYGTVVASFTIADFSLNGLSGTVRKDIDARLEELRRFTSF